MSNINAKCQEYVFAACVKIREREMRNVQFGCHGTGHGGSKRRGFQK